MAFDMELATRIRNCLAGFASLKVEEKKMFRGLAFMVNGKMCVNVSGDKMMCRFDAGVQETISKRKGYEPMLMKGKPLDGYCYVRPEGFVSTKDFLFWINLCVDFNDKAKSSKKKAKL